MLGKVNGNRARGRSPTMWIDQMKPLVIVPASRSGQRSLESNSGCCYIIVPPYPFGGKGRREIERDREREREREREPSSNQSSIFQCSNIKISIGLYKSVERNGKA
ncbi:MAG: hypothetical protein KTM48_01255 [Wolbachia endosymbiont of Pissodes strobi]|nr:hypothetical protein [Wolbachia endosymbiont of Pissodes strobi]